MGLGWQRVRRDVLCPAGNAEWTLGFSLRGRARMKIIRASPSQRLAFLGHPFPWLFPACHSPVPPSAIKTFCHCDFLLTEEGACGGGGRKLASDWLEGEEGADVKDADRKGTAIREASRGPGMRRCEVMARVCSFLSASPPKPLAPASPLLSSLCTSAFPAPPWPAQGHPSAPTTVLHPAVKRTAESANLAVGEWYLPGSATPCGEQSRWGVSGDSGHAPEDP